MRQPPTNFLEWTRKFATEESRLAELARRKWPGGFVCPRCGHDRAHMLQRRRLRQCAACRRQSSATAGTVFEHTKLPLAKWFAAMYLAAADDALVGGRRAGKRGRGAEGKQPVLFAVERKGERAGFLAAQVVDGVNHQQVGAFSRRLGDGLRVRSDAFRGLTAMARDHAHEPRPTPPDRADEWLPLAHLAISNFKRFLIGAFHGVSGKRLQEYLDESVLRFNRRFWEDQLPARLVEAAVTHVPVPLRLRQV